MGLVGFRPTRRKSACSHKRKSDIQITNPKEGTSSGLTFGLRDDTSKTRGVSNPVRKTPEKVSAYTCTIEVIQKALERAAVEFTNDGAPRVRLRGRS